jgi:hypothetical protein
VGHLLEEKCRWGGLRLLKIAADFKERKEISHR